MLVSLMKALNSAMTHFLIEFEHKYKYDDYEYDEDGNAVFEGEPVAYRGLFLIDKEGVVRHQIVNDMPLGRNVAEFLRLVDAYTHVQEKGEVCPANWEEGKEGMNADREGVASYLSLN
jgi:alkyl hydroperoxide reductase subunit AhpC